MVKTNKNEESVFFNDLATADLNDLMEEYENNIIEIEEALKSANKDNNLPHRLVELDREIRRRNK